MIMFSSEFGIRYGILLVGVITLLRGIYFRITPNREAFFSFFLFSNGVFLITFLLHSVDLSMGFAFGLFAVFAMLRYRTEPISVRDMTYLFVVIGLALMCSIAPLNHIELAMLNLLVVALAAIGETTFFAPRIYEKKINYDNIDNIKPENYEKLVADLKTRTGLNIIKVEVGQVDYLTDSARLIAFCSDSRKS